MTKFSWLALAFVVALAAMGASLWPVPYSKVSLPNTLVGPGLIVLGLAALAVCMTGQAGFFASALVIGAAAPVAILARVIVETNLDPTSHNLWPLEIILGGAASYPTSLIGAAVGSLGGKLLRRSARA